MGGRRPCTTRRPGRGSVCGSSSMPTPYRNEHGKLTGNRSYNCPAGEEVYQPACDGHKNQVPGNWRNGVMKSYTVWKQ